VSAGHRRALLYAVPYFLSLYALRELVSPEFQAISEMEENAPDTVTADTHDIVESWLARGIS